MMCLDEITTSTSTVHNSQSSVDVETSGKVNIYGFQSKKIVRDYRSQSDAFSDLQDKERKPKRRKVIFKLG